MSEVTIYNQIADPVMAVKSFGISIARSQIFGCQNEFQGEVLAMECLARRLPPLTLAERYHIIQGKLSMKADAMLAGFEESGGEYEIKEYSSEACEVIFRRGKSEIRIRITWEDAQREPWPWFTDKKTGQKVLKDNWASPIGRQDLLWARVVSRGVRRLAPGVVCGRYTPEEIVDFDANVESQSVPAVPAVSPNKAEVVEPSRVQVDPLGHPEKPEEDLVLDAEFTITDGRESKSEMHVDEPCSQAQVDEIKSLIKSAAQTGVPDIASRVKEKLAEHDLKLADLSIREADAMAQAIKMKSLDALLALSLKGVKEIPF